MEMLQGGRGGGSQMRVWRDPGSFWTPCGPRVAARSASLGGGPEAQKIHVAPPEGRNADRFQLPGGERLPESLPESIFEASFLGAPPGTQKV